jgi:hypothetical protein
VIDIEEWSIVVKPITYSGPCHILLSIVITAVMLLETHAKALLAYQAVINKDPRKTLDILREVNRERAKMSHLLHELYTWAPKYKHIIISYLKKIRYPL